MDMKNTVILLIFLLSVVGLMIGVSNTYDNSALNLDEYDEIITEHDNGTIFIHLEKKEMKERIRPFLRYHPNQDF